MTGAAASKNLMGLLESVLADATIDSPPGRPAAASITVREHYSGNCPPCRGAALRREALVILYENRKTIYLKQVEEL
jgi:hypothetical protein